jgi:hypothetical protein
VAIEPAGRRLFAIAGTDTIAKLVTLERASSSALPRVTGCTSGNDTTTDCPYAGALADARAAGLLAIDRDHVYAALGQAGLVEFVTGMGVQGIHLSLDRRRRGSVTLRCPLDAPALCRGTLALTESEAYRGRTFTRVRFSIAGSAAAPVRLQLEARALRRIRHEYRSRVLAVVTWPGHGRTVQTILVPHRVKR